MGRKAVLCRLKGFISLVLCACLVSTGLGPAAPLLAEERASAVAATWRAYFQTSPVDRSPILKPFAFKLGTEEGRERFIRIMERVDVDPVRASQDGAIQAAVGKYTFRLKGRLKDARGEADLEALRAEVDDLFWQIDLVPVSQQHWVTSRAVELKIRAAQRGVEGATAAWGEKKDGLVAPAAPGIGELFHPSGLSKPSAPEAALSPEEKETLRTLGLSPKKFDRLVAAQLALEARLKGADASLKQTFLSLRVQERFSRSVLAFAVRFQKLGEAEPLRQALIVAINAHFLDAMSVWRKDTKNLVNSVFQEFVPNRRWDQERGGLEARLLGIPVEDDAISARVARALLVQAPVLFRESPMSDRALMIRLRQQTAALGDSLSVLWAHPFTEERQLVGHKVPMKSEERLVFGYGELLRQVRAAQREPGRRFRLLIKNIEAMEPGVRAQLQEALRVGWFEHPELGRVDIPSNLQFLFTIREGTNLEDDSFYDRLVVKGLSIGDQYTGSTSPELLHRWKGAATEDDYLKKIRIVKGTQGPLLRLPGAELRLSEEFRGINDGNLHDMIYEKTGLVLDYQTVLMLAAMAEAHRLGQPILRVEGPTGLGKTFTAQGFAKLTGRSFFSNPTNGDSELADWIGGFEQDESGVFRFHGETPFKRRVEEGGVVALSELNTLIDGHEKASLAWWLVQLAETPPEADGSRVIRLTEVPLAPGEPAPTIRVHRDTVIVVDTNPESEYSARGAMPDVFKEETPVLKLEPLVSGRPDRIAVELKRLALYANMFLKHDWVADGVVLGRGISDPERRADFADALAQVYWTIASVRARNGVGERILSVRELKRMAQDVLAGADIKRAAFDHLVAAESGDVRRDDLEYLDKKYSGPVGAGFQDFVLDQLLAKKRPTHVRVVPETDVRHELAGLLAKDPAIELNLISATDETDRFQLEGGLVAREGGEGLEFGAGMFGRMIEKAKARPEKKVLYVFDNAHNLRPEQIVALNEFLQEGRLYPKGRGGELRLPPNAYVLFVSRADSPLSWSPAERSRFVELAYRPERPRPPAPKSLAEGSLAYWAFVWLNRLSRRWEGAKDAPSHARQRSFFRAAVEILDRTAALGIESARQLAALGDLAEEQLIAAVPPELRPSLREETIGWLDWVWRITPEAGHNALARQFHLKAAALARAAVEAPEAEREAKVSELFAFYENPEARVQWGAAPAAPRDGDVFKAFVEKRQEKGSKGQRRLSPDGRHMLLWMEGGRFEVHEKNERGEFVLAWRDKLDKDLRPIAIANGGRCFALERGEGGRLEVYRREGRDYQLKWNSGVPGVSLAFAREGDELAFSTVLGVFAKESWDGRVYAPEYDVSSVQRVAMSEDGGTTALLWQGGDVVINPGPRGREIGGTFRLPVPGGAVRIVLSPDGRCLAVLYSDGDVHIYRSSDGNWKEHHDEIAKIRGQSVSFSSDGTWLATVDGDVVWILRWNGLTYEKVAEKQVDEPQSLAWSPDGRELAVASEGNVVTLSWKSFMVLGSRAIAADGRAVDPRDVAPSALFARGERRGWEERVNRARLDLAGEDVPAASHREALLSVVAAHPDDASWEERTPSELKDFDVVFSAELKPREAEGNGLLHSKLFFLGATNPPNFIVGSINLPGTGKTAAAKAYAQATGVPIQNIGVGPTPQAKNWRSRLQNKWVALRAAVAFAAVSALPPPAATAAAPGTGAAAAVVAASVLNALFSGQKPQATATPQAGPDYWIVRGKELIRLSDGAVADRPSSVWGKKLKVLRLPERPVPAPPRFQPRYGDLPFYFAADHEGAVYFNFGGLWSRTRHRLLSSPGPQAAGERVWVGGAQKTLWGVELSQVRHPYSDASAPLFAEDFLIGTPETVEAEKAALRAFSEGLVPDLVGSPGAGKTSIGQEMGLLLGLPRFKFQMHGEREVSDLIGGYREDEYGRIRLTAKPYRDPDGRLRFSLPLLDMAANGGVFTLDEGPVGERGRELMSWFSALAAGDKELVLQEFPGRELRVPVHPDFHLVITHNDLLKTAGRQPLKSEIGASVQPIQVGEDESPEALERAFAYFLGSDIPAPPEDVARWGAEVARVHRAIKGLIGKELGKDNRDRYYLSKREVRRVALQVRRALRERPGEDGGYALYRALRRTYEAMFSHPEERGRAFVEIRGPIPESIEHLDAVIRHLRADLEQALTGGFGIVAPVSELVSRIDLMEHRKAKAQRRWAAGDGVFVTREEQLERYDARLKEETTAAFPAATTEHEATVEAETRELLLQGEPVLYISERGARSADMLSFAARSIGAELEPVDAAPEHGELELLGGLLPRFGPRPEGSPRARPVRGRLTRHLLTREQLQRSPAGHKPLILWLRNVDQWKEELRTALNGLLEDGYIDFETSPGRVERLYKPPWLKIAAEMPGDSTQEFSSAFFNRWVKIGVSKDSAERAGEGPSEFEEVLRRVHGLDELDIHYVAELYKAMRALDAGRGWSNRKDYQTSPAPFYRLARALQQAKDRDPALQALLAEASRRRFEPRDAPFSDKAQDYRRRLAALFVREARLLAGAKLSPELDRTAVSDAQRFERLLKIVVGEDMPPAEDEAVAAPSAEALRAALKASRLHLSAPVRRALALLSEGDRLGRAVALVGETGAAKTSVGELHARLTGRRYYKYQSHAGSEQGDLTIDVEQLENGEFKKRVKDFYRLLREGRVVIDVDEANVAPWVLWVLEPVLRGEKRVFPMFPEEEPFDVGEGVLVQLSFNPERYSGRHKIDPRLAESMIVGWVDLPDENEKARIVSSFYGVESPQEAVPAASAGVQAAPKSAAPALAFDAPRAARQGIDRLMRAGVETIGEGSAAASPRGAGAPAHGIFTPELFPYTRHAAYDQYDAATGEWAHDPRTLFPVEIGGDEEGLARDHDFFDGAVRLEGGPGWRALPAAGAGMRFLSLAAYGAEGNRLGVRLEAARDGADNCYVKGAPSGAEIRYRVAVPASYFGAPVPRGLPFAYPADVPAEVREAMAAAGLTGAESDFREVLHRMVAFFRDFSLEAGGIKPTGASLFLDLIRSRCGVCRHRAFAFARMAYGLGLKARYAVSDTHAWAEIEVPNLGWLRVDLGGGGDPMNMDLSPLANERHAPRYGDDLPEPESYRETARRYSRRMEEALTAQGLSPQHASRGREGAGGPAGEGRRIQGELERLQKELAADAKINDELAPLFASGKGDTEFVFARMLRALQSKVRVYKQQLRRGLEIDPVAYMLKKPKQFVRRRREEKLQTTALGVLLDFSGSMADVKSQLSYTIGAVGENFWKLRETAPEHFYYDLSWFTDTQPTTVVAMGERISREENEKRLVTMANRAGSGGTDIVAAVQAKRRYFLGSAQARSAKVKCLMVFTDGADAKTVKQAGGGWAPTDAMAQELAQYRAAGIDVVFIGIGPAAKQVAAFDGPGQHYVQVDAGRSEDIAEAIAKISELKSRGSGRLPDGPLNELLQITAPAP